MAKVFDLNGKQFGRLTVICEGEKARSGERMWICKCSCGNITKPIKSTCLRNGITQSCGCLHREIVSQAKATHQQSDTRLYSVWRGMKDRCFRPNAVNYKFYGGRGITVCDEWYNSFEAFYEWAMANGYAENLTIDRIDANGNYEPSNCRWITIQEQQRNRRKSLRSKL